MRTKTTLVISRLLVASLFAVGAIYLASTGKQGWGWCIFAAVMLGSVILDSEKDRDSKR